MLMKLLASSSGRLSYSVWRVLVQHVKSSEFHKDKLHRTHNLVFAKELSGKATAERPEEVDKKRKEKETRKSSSKRKVFDEVYDYLSQSNDVDVINSIPKRLFRRNRVPTDHPVLADATVADEILRCIQSSVTKEGVIVLETNPGIGILSKKLIDAGVQKLHLHEPSPVLFKTLKDFHSSHPDNVSLHSTDFLSLWKISFQDKMDNGNRVQDILSPYPKRCWTDDPYLKIVACIQSSQFIKYLILSLVSQNGLLVHCRPEMFILMPPILQQRLTCTGEAGYLLYRSMSVLFQLFFDYELLAKVPRKAYLPWMMPKSSKRVQLKELKTLSEEWVYLMRIVPKQDLYTEVISPDKIRALWYFVRHHFWSRTNRLIPEMETWIPGCGVRLIFEGYNIFTEFGDLTPEEVLHVFRLFSSWPEYQDSSFLSSMETTLLKLEENSDENMEKGVVPPEDEEDSNENIHVP